jgi:hypothetical protein
MSMPVGGQSLAPAENVGRGFILRSATPAERAVLQPHQSSGDAYTGCYVR